MNPGIGPLFYSNLWVLRMQCKNVEKTTFIIFTQFKKMHTQSFTIAQFPKIGLTHKNSPQWSRQLSQPTLCGRARWSSRVYLPKEENARSHHQRLFVENVGKTEVNRSWKIFQIWELYLRLRKVLAPLTFVSKDNNLNFSIVWNYVSKILFLFIFWGLQKRGACSYVPSIEEEIIPT